MYTYKALLIRAFIYIFYNKTLYKSARLSPILSALNKGVGEFMKLQHIITNI